MDAANLNIVTLGRSGVGKSSLLNYLIGEKRRDAAQGNPVTGEGFYEEKCKIDDINVTFFDSYGIESGENFKKWKLIIEEQRKKHDLSDNMKEWFHIVIYCLSGEDRRVQPIDTKIIKEFSQSGTRVIIAITHSDCCNEETGRILKNEVISSCPGVQEKDFVEICSVDTKMPAQEFSGSGLRNMLIQQCNENILKKIPAYCTRKALEKIQNFKEKTSQQIEARHYSFDSGSDHALWLKEECKSFSNEFCKEIYPHIINDAIMQLKSIANDLCHIFAQSNEMLDANIEFQTNLLGSSSSGLYDDFDSVFEKIGVTIFAALVFIPVAIYFIGDELINGEQNIKNELKRNLNDFCSKLEQQVKENETKLKCYCNPKFKPQKKAKCTSIPPEDYCYPDFKPKKRKWREWN